MDYSNIDEVAKAIMKYDSNLGKTFDNLPTYISNAFSEGSDLKNSEYEDAKNSLERLTLKSALEALLILKKNEKELAEEKCDASYKLYCDATDLALRLDSECEAIKSYIRTEFYSFA